jgi:putative transposase
MTAPRRILPGDVYLITRRCTQRTFLLRPDETTKQIFDYCMAEAAARFEIELLAWKAMSNHYHAVAHDPHGRLPAFLEHFHKMVAKCMNRRWGRWENFWSSEETCVTKLVNINDIVEKIVYVLCNAIESDLVGRIADWPGSSSLEYMNGKTKTIRRPKAYFKKDGVMPKEVTLRAVVPSRITEVETIESWRHRIRTAVLERETTILAMRAQKKRRVLGRKAVLRAQPTDAPPSETIHRKLRPCIACLDPTMRKLEINALQAFRIAHAEARMRWIAGDRRAIFPAGTYAMRLLGQRCAPFN